MSTGMPEVSNMEEPPYKKNLERLAALQDRLSKVQKTAESLLATVSGSGGDYTDKLVYTDVTRVQKYLETNKSLEPGLSLDDEHAVEVRFVVKFKSAEEVQAALKSLKLTSE
eukprot:CAMPEP_0179446612 /NCGR_PEP_ID=MMETSP0799-20121207/30087_1 /TAXON_ID=46947 /ORGANISM="Geminigera cryophila, Strain CCMP2564" /LENGTH=111 /DNA_ID=CAMNT_0021235887 /DNA_START=55 /DNA_END=390 /DNA_ORIENTATION=-